MAGNIRRPTITEGKDKPGRESSGSVEIAQAWECRFIGREVRKIGHDHKSSGCPIKVKESELSKGIKLQPVSRPRRTTGNLGGSNESDFAWAKSMRVKEEPGAGYWRGQVVHSEEESTLYNQIFKKKK